MAISRPDPRSWVCPKCLYPTYRCFCHAPISEQPTNEGNMVTTKENPGKPLDQNKQAVDIKGYRVLSDAEKAAMNGLKDLEREVLAKFAALSTIQDINHRSLAIAKTEMQTAFMWAVRAIARPNGE